MVAGLVACCASSRVLKAMIFKGRFLLAAVSSKDSRA